MRIFIFITAMVIFATGLAVGYAWGDLDGTRNAVARVESIVHQIGK